MCAFLLVIASQRRQQHSENISISAALFQVIVCKATTVAYLFSTIQVIDMTCKEPKVQTSC